MNIRLIFAGSTREYMGELSRYFLDNYREKYELFSFYDIDTSLDFMNDFDKNCFFVLEETFYDALSNDFIDKNSKRILLLAEERTAKHTKEILCIFKYQSAKNICAKIIEFIAENSEGELVNSLRKRAELYLFYSPVSFSGTSLISETAAFLKASKSLKVLYLSLDSFHKIRFAESSKYTASDFFMAVESKNNILANLDKMKSSYCGVDYLLPFTYELDKSILNADNFRDIISYIREKGLYDLICIDLSRSYFSYLNMLLELCDKCFFTVGNQLCSMDGYLRFKDEFSQIYQGKYDEKVLSIFNKCSKEKGILDCNYGLCYDESLEGIRLVDESVLSSAFGCALRSILDVC